MNEFEIIRSCFDRPGLAAAEDEFTRLGIGDDCALISVPAGHQLACSMDLLVEGVHFPAGADPGPLGWRALAVNLSDLAAMGAAPKVFTLGLSLPQADETWLQSFSGGLAEAAEKYRCMLVGGDVTRGPLTVCIQVHGLVREGEAITRHGAGPGDRIYVTGFLGAAGLALEMLNGKISDLSASDAEVLRKAFYHPQPRIEAGLALAEHVSAGIDISDGLLADLGHICERSKAGAAVSLPRVPVAPLAGKILGDEDGLALALHAGDDYELVLTVPPAREESFLAAAKKIDLEITAIGEIVSGTAVDCFDQDGIQVIVKERGYEHFNESG